MSDLITAFGLAMAIEGMLYALFPEGMKNAMMRVLRQSQTQLRAYGLLAASAGVALVWLVRH